jgi:Uma2 family endonuclease
LTDPSSKHQRFAGKLFMIHTEVVEGNGRGTAWISINVTDREEGWIDNHRCPDGAVILKGNSGRWIGEDQVAFLGGPDMIAEVLSRDDDTRLKFPFYAERGVREILVVDPLTGRPELWRLQASAYEPVSEPLRSVVTGLEYRQGMRSLQIRDPKTGKSWAVPAD